jgi:hypothetical protein
VVISGFNTAARPGLYNTGSFDGTQFVAPTAGTYHFTAGILLTATVFAVLGFSVALNLVLQPAAGGAPVIVRSDSAPVIVVDGVAQATAGSQLDVTAQLDLDPGDILYLTLTNGTTLDTALIEPAVGINPASYWFDGTIVTLPALSPLSGLQRGGSLFFV